MGWCVGDGGEWGALVGARVKDGLVEEGALGVPEAALVLGRAAELRVAKGGARVVGVLADEGERGAQADARERREVVAAGEDAHVAERRGGEAEQPAVGGEEAVALADAVHLEENVAHAERGQVGVFGDDRVDQPLVPQPRDPRSPSGR